MTAKLDKFLQYGVSTDIADKARKANLTVSKCRVIGQEDLVSNYGMTLDEAKYLQNCVTRQPIEEEVLQLLLENSNFTCNICKGQKGSAYIVHHIEEYEKNQNNLYNNLIVLCPNDHDMAHQSGLSMKITPKQLVRSKEAWEKFVEQTNVTRASQAIDINDDAIDYVNVNRIEELCISVFNEIPETSLTTRLQNKGILDIHRSFDQKYVQEHLSNGRYLFDYTNSGETEHYKQLMQLVAEKTDFINLDSYLKVSTLRSVEIEGRYAYFIGGVSARAPKVPITINTSTILMHYNKRRFRIEWVLDPQFLMSMSAITRIGGKNRYIIYCFVRSILDDKETKTWLIKASPLLIAQPKKWIHKTPNIAYEKQYKAYVTQGLVV